MHSSWLANFLRHLFLSWGMFPGIIATTLLALTLAWCSSIILAVLTDFPRDQIPRLLLIATIVPCIVAPLVSYVILQLLYELRAANEVAQRLTTLDELTGIHNRRYFLDAAERTFAEAVRYKLPLALALIDVDEFKSINDSRGHAGGDDVLRRIAQLCQQQLRQADVFARYGGDEFVILMPGTDAAGGRIAAERLRQSLATAQISAGEGKYVSVSIGLSTRSAETATLDQLIAAADAAMYAAKQAGRNCVR